MFELFTERARRTIFFARYEAGYLRNRNIETEHLLLGVLREDKGLATSFLGPHAEIESIRKQIETQILTRESVTTPVDLPLSQECQRVLAYGVEEASWLNHRYIYTPHLFLGLLREENSFAARILRERGLALESVRERIRRADNPPTPQESAFIATLDRWLAEREARGDLRIVKKKRVANSAHTFAVYAGDSRVSFLCIEIVGNDRFSDIQRRCDVYLAEGIAQVWILCPSFKRAYTVTKAEGFHEFRGEILRIADPLFEMDVKKIFD